MRPAQRDERVPDKTKELSRFCERCARLRGALVEHVQANHHEEIVELVQGRGGDMGMETFAHAVVELIERGEGRGTSLIDEFLATRPTLPDEQRRLVQGWKAAVTGVFEVVEARGPSLSCRNLVDELDYRILVVGRIAATLRAFPQGSFFVSSLVPARDAWLLNGSQTLLRHRDRSLAYGVAAQLAQKFPSAFFRNPEHLAAGRRLDREQHARFLELFGGPWHVASPPQAVTAYRRLLEPRASSAARAQGSPDTGAELARVREELDVSGAFPPDLMDATSVGMLSDAQRGFVLLRDFHLFLEAFELGSGALRKHRDVVRGYLESAATPARVFEVVAAAHPDGASGLFQRLLGQPDFDWASEGADLLRHHKGPEAAEIELPSCLPLGPRHMEGLLLLRDVRAGRVELPPAEPTTAKTVGGGRRRVRRRRR